MEYTFSGPAIAGSIFNILVGLGLPVALTIFIKKKWKMRIGPLFVGACAYMAANMFLQGIVDTVILLIKPLAEYFLENELPRSIFFGIVHGGVQLGGYYLIIHLFMKEFRRKENALLFGVGIRLIDSVIPYGISAGINFLILALTVNSKGMEGYLTGLQGEELEAARESIISMIQMPASEVFGTGLLGLFLMMMMIAVSVLVWQAAKREGKMYLLPTAFVICALNSFFMELYSAGIIKNMMTCVVLLGVLAVLADVLAFFVYRADTDTQRGHADILVDKAVPAAAKGTSMREKINRVNKIDS